MPNRLFLVLRRVILPTITPARPRVYTPADEVATRRLLL